MTARVARVIRDVRRWLTTPMDDQEAEQMVVAILPISLAYLIGAIVLLLTGSPGGTPF